MKNYLQKTIRPAAMGEIERIYQIALGRYDADRINGPAIKMPWWTRNPSSFQVILDDDGTILGNLNILPLTKQCYELLRLGEISDHLILPNDIIPATAENQSSHLFVEGFNCLRRIDVLAFIIRLSSIIDQITSKVDDTLLIGAVGGTTEGVALLKKLGFFSIKNNILSEKTFYEINFQNLNNNILDRFAINP